MILCKYNIELTRLELQGLHAYPSLLRISIEDTVAHGVVGFTTAGEALQATNFDIEYDAENVSVEVSHSFIIDQ